MRKLDAAIERKQANVLRLRAELAQEEADLKMLLRTRELIGEGEAPLPPARMSIPDAVESILRVAGEAHVDDLLARLHEMGLTTNKQSLTSALTRYHNRQKRFVRTGKNRYGLRDGEPAGGEDEQKV